MAHTVTGAVRCQVNDHLAGYLGPRRRRVLIEARIHAGVVE